MQSNGELTEAGRFRGKDAILPGPAGGIVGMVRVAEAAGHRRLIGFHIGGTSTDVSHYACDYEHSFETKVVSLRMRAPMMDFHTVAAGGGSICAFRDGRFQVGPKSAGAEPGLASYRRGGPLTTTDCNVMLGRLSPAHFPSVFGPNGNKALDVDVVRTLFARLAADIAAETGQLAAPEMVAERFLRTAFTSPERAILFESLSVEAIGGGSDMPQYSVGRATPEPVDHLWVWTGGAFGRVPLFDRQDCGTDTRIEGPAVIREATGTIVVQPGWVGQVDPHGNLMLTRTGAVTRTPASGTTADPVLLEVFNTLFMSVAGGGLMAMARSGGCGF